MIVRPVAAEDITTADGHVFANVTVVSSTPGEMIIQFKIDGRTIIKSIPLAALSPELRAKYGYDPKKAQDFKDEQARREAEANRRWAEAEKKWQDELKAAQHREATAPSEPPGKDTKTGGKPVPWQSIPSEHFFVYHQDSTEFAGKVSKHMEDTYEGLRKRLNFTKYVDFWLWDNRVKVYIYGSQKEMVKQRGLPEWATGAANRNKKEIYLINNENALKTTATHELGHQVFFDLTGKWNAPMWISEGMSEWLEGDETTAIATKKCQKMKKDNLLFSLKDLISMNSYKAIPQGRVNAFYCQSVSVVGYLINVSGIDTFKTFCTQLRGGMPLDNAIVQLYHPKLQTLNDLEQAWKTSLGE